MIARILGEGQYDVPDSALVELETLDVAVQAASDGGDQADFTLAQAADLFTEEGLIHG